MNSTYESQHIGPIKLDSGVGGSVTNGSVDFSGKPLAVRVEIDYPERFSEAVLQDIDMVLDNIEFVDGLARTTISNGLSDEGSTAAIVQTNWEKNGFGRDGNSAEFLEALEPSEIVVLPDGGRVSATRVVLTYVVKDAGAVQVRFMEPTGPELVPA